MGIALSCIHLSYDDFCRLTPTEFDHVYREFKNLQDAEYKDNWERMRLLATITIQPHLKKKVTAKKVLPLSWDKPDKPDIKAPRLTAAESRKRFEAVLKKTQGD